MSANSTDGNKVLHHPFLYDLFLSLVLLGREDSFRAKILGEAQVKRGDSVLDIGCGTGTLALAARRLAGPGGRVSGIDPSPQMIARAKKKAAAAGLDVEFQQAFAQQLPFPDATFDVVTSTLMLHHLPEDALTNCLQEVRRVLKKGGRFLAVDMGASAGKKGPLAHLGRRHQHFDLQRIVPVLSGLGFAHIDTGDIRYFHLRFVRTS